MTRVEKLMSEMRGRLAAGRIHAGGRLPSIRQLAREQGVSPSTVSEAYERLVAEGDIRARAGSGYFAVTGKDPVLPRKRPRDRAVDPYWVSRQALESRDVTIRPGCGWLPPLWLPQDLIRQAFRAVLRENSDLLTDYGEPQGPIGLRTVLARIMSDRMGAIAPEQILLTGSGTQAVDLVCRLCLRPGDTVLVDDPCYFNFRTLLDVQRTRVIGVRYTENGPDLESFSALLAQEKPRLYLTNSAVHNPTGVTLSLQTAHRLLVLARQHDLTIIEDDLYADFDPDAAARLATLDGLAQVIRVGSFSKTLSASQRCGYIVSTPERIEALTDLQIATSFVGVSPLIAALVQKILTGGSYRRHMDSVRRRLDRARRDVGLCLQSIGIEPVHWPVGGYALWCRLPEGCDGAVLARLALQEGMLLAPGAVFSVSETAQTHMRFNVAQMGGTDVIDHLSRLIKHVLAETGTQGQIRRTGGKVL